VAVGDAVGVFVGAAVDVGAAVGVLVGAAVGAAVGGAVGATVGAGVGSSAGTVPTHNGVPPKFVALATAEVTGAKVASAMPVEPLMFETELKGEASSTFGIP